MSEEKIVQLKNSSNDLIKYIGETPELSSLLYDIDLMPEQTMDNQRLFSKTLLIAEAWSEKQGGAVKVESVAPSNHTYIPFDPEHLEVVFSNLQQMENSECRKHAAYRVIGDLGSDAGCIAYLGDNEWRVYVDNFPGQKKYYASNLPIDNLQQFMDDIKRTGLELKYDTDISIDTDELRQMSN
ncbi:MAG: hypothetical protein QM500_19890 [Methylococcales bacterium]